MNLTKKRILIFFIPLLFSLPYINRALFVDDQFFVRIAMWLKDHPNQPYAFSLQEAIPGQSVTQEEMLTSIVNPLVHPYILSGLIGLGGDREWVWRLGCLFFSCFSGLIIFEFARRWTPSPFLSTLVVLLTPAMAVSAHSLLIDPTMNFFFLMALYGSLLSFERKPLTWSLIGGVAFGLALLTKYTAVLFAPVAVLLWYFSGRKIGQLKYCAVVLAVGFLFLAAYLYMTKMLYGQSHLAASAPITLQSWSWSKMFVLFLFIGGSLVVPLVSWVRIQTRLGLLSLLVVVCTLFWLRQPPHRFPFEISILMAVFFTSFLLFLWLSLRRTWGDRNSTDLFLLGWLGCFLGMMMTVMPWVAVRYLMIGTVPVVFLAVRLLEKNFPHRLANTLKFIGLILFLISSAIAYADYKQAESGRWIAKKMQDRAVLKSQGRYYLGEAFVFSYLKKNGWAPCPPKDDLKSGDLIMATEITFPLYWLREKNIPIRHLETMEFASRFPLKVMDSTAGASFYASAWGPIPYVFTQGPWERFHLFEVIEPVGNY